MPCTLCEPPHPFCWGGLNLQPNFQKGEGLTGPQLLEGRGVTGKEGVTFFGGWGWVAIFTRKIN